MRRPLSRTVLYRLTVVLMGTAVHECRYFLRTQTDRSEQRYRRLWCPRHRRYLLVTQGACTGVLAFE
jgi:hypothetical protein